MCCLPFGGVLGEILGSRVGAVQAEFDDFVYFAT